MVSYVEFVTQHIKDKRFDGMHQHDKMKACADLWRAYKQEHGITSAPKKKAVKGGKISGLSNKPKRNTLGLL